MVLLYDYKRLTVFLKTIVYTLQFSPNDPHSDRSMKQLLCFYAFQGSSNFLGLVNLKEMAFLDDNLLYLEGAK